jgi:chorismate mutase-like protein
MAKKKDTRKPGAAKTPAKPQVDAAVKGESKPDLGAVREQIDGIDRRIQALIAERAQWAHQVGKAKGKLAAAVDYYRPEREAQVLRKVVDRNDGPLADDVLVRLFREVMSACLAQQEPLKIGYLGPEGTFSQQAVHKHFGHSAHGLPLASIEEVFQEVAAGNADFGVVPVENSGQGTIQVTLDLFLTSPCGSAAKSSCACTSTCCRAAAASRISNASTRIRRRSRRPAVGCARICRRSKRSRFRAMPKARAAPAMPMTPRRSPASRGPCVRPEEGRRADRGPQRQHHALPGAGA